MIHDDSTKQPDVEISSDSHCSSSSSHGFGKIFGLQPSTNLTTSSIPDDPKGNFTIQFPRPRYRRSFSGVNTWNSHGFSDFTVALRALTGDTTAYFESAYFTACKLSILGHNATSIAAIMPRTTNCNVPKWHSEINMPEFFDTGIPEIVLKCSPPEASNNTTEHMAILEARQILDSMLTLELATNLTTEGDPMGDDPSVAFYTAVYVYLTSSYYGPDSVVFAKDSCGQIQDMWQRHSVTSSVSTCKGNRYDVGEGLSYGYALPHTVDGYEIRGPLGDPESCDRCQDRPDIGGGNDMSTCPIHLAFYRTHFLPLSSSSSVFPSTIMDNETLSLSTGALVLGNAKSSNSNPIFCLDKDSTALDDAPDDSLKISYSNGTIVELRRWRQCDLYPKSALDDVTDATLLDDIQFHRVPLCPGYPTPTERAPVIGIVYHCNDGGDRNNEKGSFSGDFGEDSESCIACRRALRTLLWHRAGCIPGTRDGDCTWTNDTLTERAIDPYYASRITAARYTDEGMPTEARMCIIDQFDIASMDSHRMVDLCSLRHSCQTSAAETDGFYHLHQMLPLFVGLCLTICCGLSFAAVVKRKRSITALKNNYDHVGEGETQREVDLNSGGIEFGTLSRFHDAEVS